MLRNKGNEEKKEDAGFRLKLWSTYENHFMLRPCVEVLVNAIFAKGIRVHHSTESRKLTAVAETHVSRAFLDFGKKVLESFMVQGFVVYTVAPKRKDEFFATPVVVPPTRYHVSLEEDAHYRLKHKVTQLREDARGGKKKTFFFAHSDFSPLSQRCVSAVAATTKYCSYLEHLELHDIEIQRIHANPPVLTTLKTDAAFDSRDMLGGGIPGLAAQNEHQNQALRNKINVMQYKEQADLVDLLNRNRVDTGTHAWESYLTGAGEQAPDSAFIPRFVPLPNDTTVASFAMPSELKNINESRCAGPDPQTPNPNPERDPFRRAGP